MTKDQDFPVSIEVQFLGGTGTGERPTANLCTPGTHVVMDGQLITRHCTSSKSKTYHGDQWVTVEIEVHGSRLIKHIIDGQTVLEYTAPQLDPNINSTFDLRTLLLNQQGPLSGDITHAIKVYLAKEFVITPTFSATLGGSFNANSGTPINALGAHPIYGAGQAFILERGSAGRLPWVTSLDAKVNPVWASVTRVPPTAPEM